MKNLLKVMAALLVVALPFVVASCGGDDEEKGPETYNYSWLLQETQLPSSATTAEKQAALTAESVINSLFAAEFIKRGFKVNASEQTFSIVTEDEASVWDAKVKQASYTVKGLSELAIAVDALPTTARIVVKRGNTTVFNEKLR